MVCEGCVGEERWPYSEGPELAGARATSSPNTEL
jgi:hypothetical protein